MLTPLLRHVSSRARSLNRRIAFGAIRRFGSSPAVKLKPRNFRSISSWTTTEHISARIWRTLHRKQERNSYLFPTENETPLRLDNLRERHLLPKLAKVGLEWATFQVLRRTNASLSREANIDAKVAAHRRGHGLGISLETYSISGVKQRIDAAKRLETEVIQ